MNNFKKMYRVITYGNGTVYADGTTDNTKIVTKPYCRYEIALSYVLRYVKGPYSIQTVIVSINEKKNSNFHLCEEHNLVYYCEECPQCVEEKRRIK